MDLVVLSRLWSLVRARCKYDAVSTAEDIGALCKKATILLGNQKVSLVDAIESTPLDRSAAVLYAAAKFVNRNSEGEVLVAADGLILDGAPNLLREVMKIAPAGEMRGKKRRREYEARTLRVFHATKEEVRKAGEQAKGIPRGPLRMRELSPLSGAGFPEVDVETARCLTPAYICREQAGVIAQALQRAHPDQNKTYTIVDPFVGTGNLLVEVALFARTIGIDINEERIDKARDHARARGVPAPELIHGDALTEIPKLRQVKGRHIFAVVMNPPFGSAYKSNAPADSHSLRHVQFCMKSLRAVANQVTSNVALVLPATIKQSELESALPQGTPIEWEKSLYQPGHPKAGRVRLYTVYCGELALATRLSRAFELYRAALEPLFDQFHGRMALMFGPEAATFAATFGSKMGLSEVQAFERFTRTHVIGKRRALAAQEARRLCTGATSTKITSRGPKGGANRPEGPPAAVLQEANVIFWLHERKDSEDPAMFDEAQHDTHLVALQLDLALPTSVPEITPRPKLDASKWRHVGSNGVVHRYVRNRAAPTPSVPKKSSVENSDPGHQNATEDLTV